MYKPKYDITDKTSNLIMKISKQVKVKVIKHATPQWMI